MLGLNFIIGANFKQQELSKVLRQFPESQQRITPTKDSSSSKNPVSKV